MTRTALGAFLLLFAACSSDGAPSSREDDSKIGDDGGAPPPAEAAAANEIAIHSEEIELEPGDEKYMCWAENLPADSDVVIRKIRGDYGPGTHHVFFAWTLAPEPAGTTECPVLFKTTWIPIYLGGQNTSPLQMPDGAAVELPAGQQLVLQLHLQNTTTEAVKNRVTMHLELGEPGEEYVPAGIFGLDNRVIDLPAGSSGVETSMSCKAPKDMNVFAVLGHMHKLGEGLRVTRNDTVEFEESWNFEEQPITPFEMTVEKDDLLGVSCTHSNPLTHAVGYGESSDNEMCATVFYYTPYDNIDGCINFPEAAPAQ
jgi:hypothetical protein